MPLIALGALSLVAAALATPLAMTLARRVGVVDHPGPLKPQGRAVPYLGGLGVAAGLVPGLLTTPWRALPLAGALALGVLDDARDLPAGWRLVGEMAVGVGVAATVAVRVGGPGGWLLVVAATVILMNAVNLLDGRDALVASVAAVAGGGFALLLGNDGRRLGVALAAGLVGFALYNRPPARVYLGDGGAYLVGATLAVLLAETWAPHGRSVVAGAGVLVVVVPAGEIVAALIRRVRARRSFWAGDRRHLYDLLVARVWPLPAVDAAYGAAEAVLVALAVVVLHRGGVTAAAVAVAVAAAVVLVVSGAGGALRPDTDGAPSGNGPPPPTPGQVVA